MNKCEFNTIDYSMCGFYRMALFTMYVNGKLSPQLEDLPVNIRGTFVHEYIHFLQNITTISGLRYSSFYLSFVIKFIKWLKKQDNLNIPIDMKSVCSSGALNRDYQFFRNLSGTLNIFDFDLNQELLWNFNPKGKRQKVYFKVVTFDGKDEYVTLGTHGIRESMAALYQSLIDEESEAKHPAYPYRIVSFIVSHLFPDIYKDKKKLICICQIALNSPEPDKTLFEWLSFAQINPHLNGLDLYNEHQKVNYLVPHKSKKGLRTIKAKKLLINSSREFEKKLYAILNKQENNYSIVLKKSQMFSDIHLRILYFKEDLLSGIKLIIDVCGVPFIFNDSGDIMNLTRQQNAYSDDVFMDQDIVFLMSLDNLCSSFLLSKDSPINKCVFRTIHCNKIYSQAELSEHVFCNDEPWREQGCRYWEILRTLGLDKKTISYG